MNVSGILGKWYDEHKRDLPWRETKDPYKIWLSEIILQQTRVNQGIDYYYKFLLKFPTIADLASTPLDELLKVWQGLGYYSRARNMHIAANSIVADYNGNFPPDFNSLRNLKGIGDYSAAAISSIAFNQPHPVIDGNVYRVLARLFSIDLPKDTAQGKKVFYDVALKLLDIKNPGRHNQALMELGAIVCLPLNPKCKLCPLALSCISYKNNSVDQYPLKKRKAFRRDRYFYYLIIKKGDTIYINQRLEGDIWAYLYEFPLIETEKNMNPENIFQSEAWKELAGDDDFKVIHISKEYKHQLTHQIIHARFIEIEANSDYVLERFIEIRNNEIMNYPVSRLIDKYLKDQ